MRNIKFRAWDGRNMFYPSPKHQMLSPEQDFSIDLWSDGWEFVHMGDRGLIADDANGTLMQYTGVKDKSGVEIYEGDIIEWKRAGDEPVYGIDKVTWHGYGFHIPGQWVGTDFLEIVGNIYQNPELLTSAA